MENAMLALAPIGFFAITGLIACGMLGWLLHDMMPLLKAPEPVDLRKAARRAAYTRPRQVIAMPRPARAHRMRVAA